MGKRGMGLLLMGVLALRAQAPDLGRLIPHLVMGFSYELDGSGWTFRIRMARPDEPDWSGWEQPARLIQGPRVLEGGWASRIYSTGHAYAAEGAFRGFLVPERLELVGCPRVAGPVKVTEAQRARVAVLRQGPGCYVFRPDGERLTLEDLQVHVTWDGGRTWQPLWEPSEGAPPPAGRLTYAPDRGLLQIHGAIPPELGIAVLWFAERCFRDRVFPGALLLHPRRNRLQVAGDGVHPDRAWHPVPSGRGR